MHLLAHCCRGLAVCRWLWVRTFLQKEEGAFPEVEKSCDAVRVGAFGKLSYLLQKAPLRRENESVFATVIGLACDRSRLADPALALMREK